MKIEYLNENTIKVKVESLDDLLYLYMLLKEGDIVWGYTSRQMKVHRGYGSERIGRISAILGIKLKKIKFRAFDNKITLMGVIVDAPEHLEIEGKHHSIIVSEGTMITIFREYGWEDKLVQHIISRARKLRRNALIVALDQEECAIGLISDQGLKVLTEIEGISASKRGYKYDKREYEIYLDKIIKNIINELKRTEVKKIILYGPGFIKEKVHKKLIETGIKNIVVFSGSIGGIGGIKEALRNEKVEKVIGDIDILEDLKMVRSLISEHKVALGLSEVEKAANAGAIDTLIISSDFLKDPENFQRIKNIALTVNKYGGKIRVIYEDSEAGELLKKLANIGAILRYNII